MPYYLLFSVELGEPDVPPAAPLVLLPEPEADESLEPDPLVPEPLLLGDELLGEDELLPDPELELGLDGVVPEDDEDELGELGVVALPDPDIEPEPRLVVSPDAPDEDDDPVAPELAPRLASPALSQPYRPPTAMARGRRTMADFLSINRLL